MSHDNRRKSKLGRFGEIAVCEQLSNNGWQNCRRIGGRCFDIEAYYAGQRYLISVKTRNNTTDKSDLKTDCYNLLYNKRKADDVNAEVKMAEEIARQRNAIPMWVALTVDAARKQYDMYHGLVADLENKKRIPMSPSDKLKHKKLAQNVIDQRIDPTWSNVRG
jgi:hypothetical protein